MSAFAVLASIRDALAAVQGVKTCKIGMEANITPADYPLVRIVPSSMSDPVPRIGAREIEALIYFGLPLHEFTDGLEAVYEALLPFEQKLLDAARAATGVATVVHDRTILDEDRIEAYKLFALKVRIVG
jgi:hypothetical protein